MQSKSVDSEAPPIISFDKDDEDTLDFVAAGSNLRSIVFGIETRSRFDIKQMAGNIIPAIATTNAIVAGLCVLQSFKVLRGDFSSTKEVSVYPICLVFLLRLERRIKFGSDSDRSFYLHSHQSACCHQTGCDRQIQTAQYAV